MRIDAHQHFWHYNDSMTWIDESMSVISRDFLPADLAPVLEANGIDGCIAVQAEQSAEETHFLLKHAVDNGFIKGVVGWVDLRAAGIEEQLSEYSRYPKLKGFRHVLQTETPQFMLQPDFLRGIGALNAFDFTYDLLVFPKHLPAVLELIKQFPMQSFVIDHIAKPGVKQRIMDGWEKDIRAIAKQENVYCKVSGLVTEANWKAWKQEDFVPYLDVVTEAFGTKRIMYGSDWPVCLIAASYEEVVGIVKKYYSTFSAEEQQAIFGNNASKFYQLS